MRPSIASRLALCATAALALAGCGGASFSNASPDGAIMAAATALQNNDLKGLMETVLPAEKMAALRSEFEEGKKKNPMDDQAKAQFNMTLTMVTADTAEATLFAMVQPQLAGVQEQVKMYSGMVAGMAAMATQKEGMSDAEKAQAAETVAAIQAWATSLDVTDEAKIKQAIAIVCSTARGLGIKNADEFAALSFDQMLTKAGPAIGGVKQILALYGIDLNATLSSIKTGAPVIEGDSAKIPVTVTLFGKTSTTTAELMQKGGKWFGAPALED